MKIKESGKVRENILNTAIKLFAEKGYEYTTIRELCKQAKTYQLAINYHFGSKENLYREALLKSFEWTEEKDFEQLTFHLTKEEQIKAFIYMKMNNIFLEREKGVFYRILSHENHTSPKSHLKEIFDLTFLPNHNYFKTILKEVSKKSDDFLVEYYAFTIVSQIKSLAINNCAIEKLFGVKELDKEKVDTLVNQMSHFVITGIKNISNEDK